MPNASSVALALYLLLQWATWKLGGNLVALFFGLRLITSVVGSKIILGQTVVQTGVQVGGLIEWNCS